MLSDEVHITFRDICLTASLKIPHEPRGLIIIAAGKDCPTLKVQHEHLLRVLNRHHMATLFTYLMDSPDEQEYDNPFDINKMSDRLLSITRWAFQQPALQGLPAGYFAVNVAAAAALKASIKAGSRIKAIVCRCGRPDLINYELPLIRPALLLITASENVYINEVSKQAYKWLNCEKEIVMLEGGINSFEGAGKAFKIAQLTADWFLKHLIGARLRIFLYNGENPTMMAE